MVDRLMPVGGQRSRWQPELPVEVDGGGEGEDARGDAADESAGGSREMALEAELLLERVDDRLDALADAPDRRRGALWFVGAGGAEQEGAEFGDGLLEVGAREAFVGDHELTDGRLPAKQLERGLALGSVGGDEVEVPDATVRAAPEDEPHAPVEARVGGRVAEAAPGRELGAVDRLHALPAGQRGRVHVAERVVEAGQLAGDRAPQRDQLGRKLPTALLVARLARQRREEMPQPPSGGGKEAAIARPPQQHLRDHQREQFVVGNQLRTPAPPLARGRKERASSAIDCDHEGVEVGAHVGLLVDGALTPPTFDTRLFSPYPVNAGQPVDYRSSI